MRNDEGRGANALAKEKSPYLLQHAHNPVQWYPWGEEAFARARREDKPIFLSVGYSTCHWCHVMERESFEDPAIAGLMNDLFVNVKVDREERPDVDQIYMAAVQAISGHGGWPMSVFLTPDLKPFYAGTYYPPTSKHGRPGFPDVLKHFAKLYAEKRDTIIAQGEKIGEWIASASAEGTRGSELPDREPIEAAVRWLAETFDPDWGGFGEAPKFPRSMTLMLLLRDRQARGDDGGRKLAMVDRTLEMMARGGIHDHVGGGFARYSVDDEWLVPHFEKMLYDNALLAMTYLEGWQVTQRDVYRRVVVEILDWVRAEMTHEGGGYLSAIDADSEGEEGRFYVWSPEELVSALGADDAAFVAEIFDVTPGGNFEGKTILAQRRPLSAAVHDLGMTEEEAVGHWSAVRCRLYRARARRVHPHVDDKVLASWNGLMIAAMARAGAVLDETHWLESAVAAARFAEENLMRDGVPLRRWRDGESALDGTLEDYAFLAFGYFELFDAVQDPHWLERAYALTDEAVARFGDPGGGGFFFTQKSERDLIVRMKDGHDGAMPSGNAMMVANLLRRCDYSGDEAHRHVAERTVAAFAEPLSRSPMAHPFLLCGLDRLLAGGEQVFIAVGDNADERDHMLRVLRSRFAPHRVIVTADPERRDRIERLCPWIVGKSPVDGETAAWICRDFTCRPPVTAAERLATTGS